MDNNFPILILYAQGAQRVLTNDISNGLCVCPVSVNLDNLHNAQIKMKNISLHYITEFTQLIDTLSVTVDKEITKGSLQKKKLPNLGHCPKVGGGV